MSLKSRRLAANYSLTQLGHLANINPRVIAAAEAGGLVSADELDSIEQALKQAERAPSPDRKRMGFENMDPNQLRYITAAGGRKAHELGTAHEFTKEEASAAGRLGGLAHSREYMRELARRPRRKRS